MNYERLEEKRIEIGMSKVDLCTKAGINTSTYWRILTGSRKTPQFDIIKRLCEVLDLDLSEL